MHENVDQKRVKVGFATFLLCAISGSLIGYFGLQSYNEQLTVFSAGLYTIGVLVFFVCLVYPLKRDGFWFSYLLKRLGRIGWLRRFEISQHAEGAITLTLLLSSFHVYNYAILGGVSYLLNDLSTLLFLIFTYSWILTSMHRHFQSIKGLSDLSKIITNDQQNVNFTDELERTTISFNKMSVILLILGAIVFVCLGTFWIDPRDEIPGRCTFYLQKAWSGLPTFGMAYPLTWLSYVFGKVLSGLTFGVFALIAGLVILTTVLLLRLTSRKIQATIDIYDADCIKPAEHLVNSFWLLTGAGLLFVPYMTALASNFRVIHQTTAARWTNYVSWAYVIFFIGFFFFSLTRFFSFISAAKKPVEQQIRAELKDALEAKIDHEKLEAAKIKMRLLQGFKSRPTLTTVLQLIQIVIIVLLNVLIRLLE